MWLNSVRCVVCRSDPMLEGDGIKTLSIKPIKSHADHCGMRRWEAGNGPRYG